MTSSPNQLVLLPILLMAMAMAAAGQRQLVQQAITLPGCPDKCGNIVIPFPFGMKSGCFLEGFQVTCNDTHFHPPRPFLLADDATHWMANNYYLTTEGEVAHLGNGSMTLVELMDISVGQGEARVYGAVRSDCSVNDTYHSLSLQVTYLQSTSPFLLSATRNVLVGVGSNVQAKLTSSQAGTGGQVSCVSLLEFDLTKATNGSCSGMGCCQAAVPPTLSPAERLTFSVSFKHQNNTWRSITPCSYGMVVEKSWYNFSSEDMYGDSAMSNKYPRGVPLVLDFAVRAGSCPVDGQMPPACRSGNSSCVNATSGAGYVCKCWENYDGNPYIPNGCQDIDECVLRDQNLELRNLYPCSDDGICKNKLGGYDCPCKPGMKGDGKAGACTDKFPLTAKVAVGVIGGTSIIIVVALYLLLVAERRKKTGLFIKNGGNLLEKANSIKIFRKKEIKQITNNYSEVLGKGGFGKVYKGFLDDKRPVAVKRSIIVDESQKDQFANEVIIQSQIIHKNIIKLIGCCLEVDVPMLVYEFLSNGSLHDVLHGSSNTTKDMPLTLDMRLNIAVNSAKGLAYMHAETSSIILHGDVKPANILLDDNFVPKISDFGISRRIAMDRAQHTKSVIGDMSYMDPVYLQTGLLTTKSDVYSFGVVLLEMITRKRANYGNNNSLVKNFVDSYKRENASIEFFDKEIAVQKDMEFLHKIAKLVVECLNYDVDQRPEMVDVHERLETIRRL